MDEAARHVDVLGVAAVQVDHAQFPPPFAADRIAVLAEGAHAAALDALDHYRVAGLQVRDVRAGAHDAARELVTGHDRITRLAPLVVTERAVEDFEVGGADAFVCHANQHIAGLHFRQGHVLQCRPAGR